MKDKKLVYFTEISSKKSLQDNIQECFRTAVNSRINLFSSHINALEFCNNYALKSERYDKGVLQSKDNSFDIYRVTLEKVATYKNEVRWVKVGKK